MNVYIKSLIYLMIFSILHFGYDLTHWAFLIPLCGINESVFQHLKMVFWAYFLVNLVEYFVIKRKVSERKTFWYPKLLSTIIIPWIVMIIWYFVPVLFGRVESLVLNVSWSVFSTYSSGVIVGIIEKNIEKNLFTSNFKMVILILIIVSAFLYVWFTYKPPWIDLFINPEIL